MDFGLIAGLVVPALLGLVWLVRLEGRINGNSIRIATIEKRVDGLEERILAKLDRIEEKLDRKADK